MKALDELRGQGKLDHDPVYGKYSFVK